MDSLISPVLPTAAVLPAASSPLSASAAALLLHNPSNTEAASTSSREADDGSARGGRRHSPRLTDPLLIAREAKKIRQETATLRKQPIQLAASASEESHEQQRERMAEDGQKLEEYTQPLSPPGRRVKPSTSQSERSVEEEEHGDEGTDAERNEDDISSGGQTQREEEDTDSSEPDSELIVEEALAALTSHFSATARSVEHCKRSLRESLRRFRARSERREMAADASAVSSSRAAAASASTEKANQMQLPKGTKKAQRALSLIDNLPPQSPATLKAAGSAATNLKTLGAAKDMTAHAARGQLPVPPSVSARHTASSRSSYNEQSLRVPLECLCCPAAINKALAAANGGSLEQQKPLLMTVSDYKKPSAPGNQHAAGCVGTSGHVCRPSWPAIVDLSEWSTRTTGTSSWLTSSSFAFTLPAQPTVTQTHMCGTASRTLEGRPSTRSTSSFAARMQRRELFSGSLAGKPSKALPGIGHVADVKLKAKNVYLATQVLGALLLIEDYDDFVKWLRLKSDMSPQRAQQCADALVDWRQACPLLKRPEAKAEHPGSGNGAPSGTAAQRSPPLPGRSSEGLAWPGTEARRSGVGDSDIGVGSWPRMRAQRTQAAACALSELESITLTSN